MNDDTAPKFPPSMPLDKQIEHMHNTIASLKRQIADLTRPTPQETALEKTERERDERAARTREREERHAAAAAAELQHARAAAIRAIARLLPEAIKQAKAKPPRPALLRMILRATK